MPRIRAESAAEGSCTTDRKIKSAPPPPLGARGKLEALPTDAVSLLSALMCAFAIRRSARALLPIMA